MWYAEESFLSLKPVNEETCSQSATSLANVWVRRWQQDRTTAGTKGGGGFDGHTGPDVPVESTGNRGMLIDPAGGYNISEKFKIPTFGRPSSVLEGVGDGAKHLSV